MKRLIEWVKNMITKKDPQLENIRAGIQSKIDYLLKESTPLQQNSHYRNEFFTTQSKMTYLRSNEERYINESNQIIESFPETMRVFENNTECVCYGVPFWALQRMISQPDVMGNNLRLDSTINRTFEGLISPKEIAVHPISDITYALADAEMDAYKECLPSGVVFILSAEGQTPEQRRPINHFGNEMCLDAVSLHETNRIKAILTTSETKGQVESLLREYGYEKAVARVSTFTEYENLIQHELQQQYDSPDLDNIR